MRKLLTAPIASLAIVACLSTAPLFAGALILEIDSPQANPEASSRHALVLARVTECKSPEKTVVTATAEGIVSGKRQSIPLKLIQLSTPGLYAVSRDWPIEGKWAIKLVVTNPDYGKYVTAVVVPAGNEPFRKDSVQHFFRIPTEQDVASVLSQNGL